MLWSQFKVCTTQGLSARLFSSKCVTASTIPLPSPLVDQYFLSLNMEGPPEVFRCIFRVAVPCDMVSTCLPPFDGCRSAFLSAGVCKADLRDALWSACLSSALLLPVPLVNQKETSRRPRRSMEICQRRPLASPCTHCLGTGRVAISVSVAHLRYLVWSMSKRQGLKIARLGFGRWNASLRKNLLFDPWCVQG